MFTLVGTLSASMFNTTFVSTYNSTYTKRLPLLNVLNALSVYTTSSSGNQIFMS